jgi:hypothetical protein
MNRLRANFSAQVGFECFISIIYRQVKKIAFAKNAASTLSGAPLRKFAGQPGGGKNLQVIKAIRLSLLKREPPRAGLKPLYSTA